MNKHILIIGGSSGLGLALAQKYAALGHTVTITGRTDPNCEGVRFVPLAITHEVDALRNSIDSLVGSIPPIENLIYAAGYYQEGRVDELSDDEMLTMLNVGLTAPMLLVHRFKRVSAQPLKVILITSSSQVTPREKEPVYTAVKAGLGMFGNSLSLDQHIGKVVVVAPAGMKTPFWNNEKDTATFLEPSWVAEHILELSSGSFKYKFAKILREPARAEVVEVRQ